MKPTPANLHDALVHVFFGAARTLLPGASLLRVNHAAEALSAVWSETLRWQAKSRAVTALDANGLPQDFGRAQRPWDVTLGQFDFQDEAVRQAIGDVVRAHAPITLPWGGVVEAHDAGYLVRRHSATP